MAHRKKYPLQIHIATVFIALVAILGLVLTIFSYQNARVLQEHLATELTEKNAHQLRTTFEKLTLPVLTTLDTLALAPFIADNESGKRKAWLSAIQAVMDRNPEVVSIYYGREDESSYFVRSTVKAFMKRQFDAPQQSVLMMDVNSPDGKRIRRFFDSELSLLSELVESDVDYKPTTRPWYQVAPENGAVNITEPYMYYFIKRLASRCPAVHWTETVCWRRISPSNPSLTCWPASGPAMTPTLACLTVTSALSPTAGLSIRRLPPTSWRVT